MYDINNLTLDPITAARKSHKAAQNAVQSAESHTSTQHEEIPTAGATKPQNAVQQAAQSEERPVIMTLHASSCRGKGTNTVYKHEVKVRSEDDLIFAVSFDHMASKMVSDYRNTDNFLECDCIMVDIDNTHTEDPDKWKTADDIAEALPVNYFLVRSRNYMKPKSHTDKKTGYKVTAEPREKWHLYAPLAKPIRHRSDYEALIKNVVALFPFIDIAAIDAARFFYAVEEPHITPEAGECYIDEYISNMDPAELRQAQTDAITEFAAHMIDGSYKDDKANQTTVKIVCELLGIKNPLPTAAPDQAPNSAAESSSIPNWLQHYEQDSSEQWFLKWAEKYNVELGERYTGKRKDGSDIIVYCVTCPWEEEHTPGKYPENEAVVIIEESGQLSYLCRHRHGAALNWKKYRAYYESRAPKEQPQQGAQEAAQGQAQPQEDYLTAFFNQISGKTYKPYSTDLTFFDNLLNGGPVKKTMLLLLAAPGAGKTTLCQQIAESMAEHGKPVLYLNFEMSREQMIAKSISARCTLAGQPMTALDVLQGYRWYPEQREAVENALDQFRERIAPRLDYNPDGITADLEKLAAYLETIGERAKAAGEPAPVVVIDYLHLLTWSGEEVANVIKKSMEILKDYAKNYDTISIAISATNRDSNKAGRITMESGRDSSGIEYAGDYILSLNYYQVDQGNVRTTDNDKMAVLTGRKWRQMILRVLKNRWGIAGRPARVYFHAAGNRFYAEDDILPEDQGIIHFGDYDQELEDAGQVVGKFDINNSSLPENKTPKAGRKR